MFLELTDTYDEKFLVNGTLIESVEPGSAATRDGCYITINRVRTQVRESYEDVRTMIKSASNVILSLRKDSSEQIQSTN